MKQHTVRPVQRRNTPKRVRVEVYERRYVGYPPLWQAYLVARNHHALLMVPAQSTEAEARALAEAEASARGWTVLK